MRSLLQFKQQLSRGCLRVLAGLTVGAVGWQSVLAEPYTPKIYQIDVPPPVVIPSQVEVPPLLAKPIRLSEAVEIALQKQSQLISAQAQAQAATARTDQVRAGQNFRLNVGGTYTDVWVAANPFAGFGGGFAGGSFGNFNQDSGQGTVSLRKMLFDFHHTRDLTAQSDEQAKATAFAADKVKLDVVTGVRQQYFAALQSQRLVKVQEANLESRRHQFDQAQARFKAGLGLPLDVSRTQSAIADAVLQLTQARNDSQIALVTLANLMGVDPRISLQLAEETVSLPMFEKPEDLYQKALELRPEMLQARALVSAQAHGLSAAHSTSAPVVNVSLGYVAGIRPIFSQTNAVNLVFSINYDLFDGGLQDAKVREAQANLDAAKAQLEGIGQTILTDVSTSYLRLKSAEQKIQTAEIQEQNAQESLRLADGRYKVGLGILIDVLDAQANLLSAQTNRVNAQTQLDLAKAGLARAVGTLN